MQQLGPDAVGQVFEYLKGAQSSQTTVQKSSEAALKTLQSQPGYCSCLAEIIRNKQADHSARWLGSIEFKNTIARSWKSRAGQGGIVDAEKAHLRQVLVQLIDQENSQIAVPIAVAFAKVARADYPRQWPTLFQDVMSRLNSQETLTVRRVYLVLHHTVKELASMRLPGDKRNFAEVTRLLYEPYWNQWCSDTQALMQGLGEALKTPQQPTPLAVVFERWFLELKGLQRMVLFSTQSDAVSLQAAPAVSQVVPAGLQALQAFHAVRPASEGMRAQLHAMLDRSLIKLAKALQKILDMHPWSFYHSGCFGQCLQYFTGQLVVPPRSGPAYERFLMQCMVLVHTVLTCKAYRGVPEALQMGDAAQAQAAQIKQMATGVQTELAAFWEASNAQTLCRALVHLYFPLTTKELQEWADNPEEFSQQAGTGVWQDSLRTCAETLFTTLLGANREGLAPLIMEELRIVSEACPSGRSASVPGPGREGIPEAVLAKEAVYNAVGAGAWELLDHVDFTSWLHAALLPELADTSPENRPLRRRAGLLLGQWVSKLKAQDRPAAYRALLGLIADDDFCTSLAGVSALHDLINDWDFQEEPFLEFVSPTLQLLAGQLHAASQYETQLQVFNLVNLIFDRLAESVKPFTGTILQLLPDLWRQSEDQSLLRIQILLAIQRVVNALGMESPSTYPLILPILQQCTDPNQKDELNLLEDGLQLWLVALRNAPEPHPQLLGLFPNLVTATERSTEHMQETTQIMCSCVLLGGRGFLEAHGGQLVGVLARLIGHLSEKGSLLLLPVMDAVLQTVPAEGPSLLDPALRALLAAVHSGSESGLVIAASLDIFARLLLQSSAAFVSLFQSAPGPPGGSALEAFVDLWLERFDTIQSMGSRKLSALALCLLLQLPAPWILRHLTGIVANITSVWYEVEGNEIGGQAFGMEAYNWLRPHNAAGSTSSAAAVNSEEAEGEYRRRLALHEKDLVGSLKLSEFLREQLGKAAAVHGSDQLNHALNALDPSLASQLRAALGQQPP